MRRIGAFIARQPIVLTLPIVPLWALFLARREDDYLAILFCMLSILWIWGWAAFAFLRPLSARRVLIAMPLSLPVFLLLSGAVWVSEMAIYVVLFLYTMEALYLVVFLMLIVRNIYRWLHTDAPGGNPQPMELADESAALPSEPQEDSAPEAAPINPVRLRKLFVVLGLIVLVAAGCKLADLYKHVSLQRLLEQPEARCNMALYAADEVLYRESYQIRNKDKIYLYTQEAGLDTVQAQQLADDIAMQMNVSCELGTLTEDLHGSFLTAPDAVHLVLRPPIPVKSKEWEDNPKGWLAQGEMAYAYVGQEYDSDSKQYYPRYQYGIRYTKSIYPTYKSPPGGGTDGNAQPPSGQQQEQITALLANWQLQRDVDIDPETLPFKLTLPDFAVAGRQYNNRIELGTLCPASSCTTGHNTVTLRWTGARSDYTLDNWRLAQWGMGGEMYDVTVGKLKMGDYPVRLISGRSKYTPHTAC